MEEQGKEHKAKGINETSDRSTSQLFNNKCLFIWYIC